MSNGIVLPTSGTARERISVRVVSVNSESPSIKSVQLDVGRPYPFFAGQWIDVWTPHPSIRGELICTGYSLISNPLQPAHSGKIAFAVRRTAHPATQYIHEDLYANDTLEISAEPQGSCFFTSDMGRSVVLIAGGIGITPMLSICRYICACRCVDEAHLFYSCRDPLEMAFHEDLKLLADKSRGLLKLHFTATGETRDQKTMQGLADVSTTFMRTSEFSSFVNWRWPYLRGRLTAQLIRECITSSALTSSHYYLCGPNQMITDLEAQIQKEIRVNPARIHYEKWWA
jgi:ferredoxin-NADP reductase